MACASYSVIAGCALVGVDKAANKPKLIRIAKIVRFIARSTVFRVWRNLPATL
jgi:hypothetical protein